MAELLTKQIVYEYQKRLKALPEYGNQDIKERRELRIELQNRCGITELQALNVLNGHHVPDIITICERKRWEDEFNDKYGNQDNQGLGKVRRRAERRKYRLGSILQAGRYCERRCLRLLSGYSTAENTHSVIIAGRRTSQPHDESKNREVSGDIRHI